MPGARRDTLGRKGGAPLVNQDELQLPWRDPVREMVTEELQALV